jgi:oligoendopeptidase F
VFVINTCEEFNSYAKRFDKYDYKTINRISHYITTHTQPYVSKNAHSDNYLSYNDTFNYVFSFYKQLSCYLFNEIKEIIESHDIKAANDKNMTNSSKFNEQSKRVELTMKLTNSFDDVLTVGHELIHGIGWKNYGKSMPKDSNLAEIESMFIEYLLNDYLLENNFNKREIYNRRLERYDLLYWIAIESYFESKIFEIYNTTGYMSLNTINQYIKSTNIDLKAEVIVECMEKILSSKLPPNYKRRYMWGELVSLRLYNQFQVMPTKTMNIFIEYLKNCRDLYFDEGLKLLNIDLSDETLLTDYKGQVGDVLLKVKKIT